MERMGIIHARGANTIVGLLGASCVAGSVLIAALAATGCSGDQRAPQPLPAPVATDQPGTEPADLPEPAANPDEVVRTIVTRSPSVVSWEQVPVGNYLMTQYRHVIRLRTPQGVVAATYVHNLRQPGKIQAGDETMVGKERLPAGTSYSVSLPISLPQRIRPAAHGALGGLKFSGHGYYEPTFTHEPGQSMAFVSFKSSPNPKQGLPLFSVVTADLANQVEGKTYYAGAIGGFSEENGNLYGWVQSYAGLNGVIDVTVLFQKADSITMITAQFVDAAKLAGALVHR